MKASTYLKVLKNKIKTRIDIILEYNTLQYSFGLYKNVIIKSKNLNKNTKTLYIRAGIHGEEIAGPLTILGSINNIINYAHKKNITLIINPLSNPAGFEKKTRYSDIDNPPKHGNNDIIRYKLSDGNYSDDIGEKDISKGRQRSNKIEKFLPPETIFEIQEFQKNTKIHNIVGILDIHQDYITKTQESLTYQYGFGNTSIYNSIIQKIKKYCKIYKGNAINAGFKNRITDQGIQSDGIAINADKNGRIIRHDGTLGAAAYKLGVPFNITCETTGITAYKIAKKVNLARIYGLINLISQSKTKS